MLKPERVTFSADDEEFNQFANSDRLNSILNHSLVHYSTDFQKTEQQSTSIRHSHSLDELSSITMTSQQQQNQQQQQQQQQQQEITQDPPASAPPSLISTQTSVLNENNLHQFDALTLQQIAVGTNHHISNLNEDDMKASSTHTTSLAEIQKEVDRVKQMKYGRTYSSPTSSLCSRLTTNPFNGSTTTNIDISSITHPVHFNEQSNQINHLPFSSTYITSIPESIVPASISSATNEIHFIPINSVESPSIEDREVFETFHTKPTSMPGIAIRQSVNSLNRDISTSETDLISSLHRSVSKQGADTQSEHGTTYSGASDDLIFVEWDKERSLFQDYINSLRTEIRVLLQERSEYQKQMETVNNNLSEHKRLNLTHMNNDQSKLELLQKSLEEKNFVLEQLQKEYENMKEKNTNLTRKISVLRCDGKSQLGVIDELKEKIAELTVDIQNHILVKRRLEVSMMNLESDCKLIDAERIRLTNDIREAQSSRQDLEKLLQHANVQIAEQGNLHILTNQSSSTIEMLRSDNIQVRSQLSTTQRRMLQEKQQVMDYLRQIESDLVENEQIKQRELILRKDFEKLQLNHQQDRHEIEQLNTKINQDKQKLNELEQDRLQLLRTIENMDDNKIQLESELNSYKSATKRLYTHFKLPFDSIQSIDQLLPMIEDRYRTEQVAQARIHNIPLVQSTSDSNIQHEMEDTQLLREELASMNIRLKQLNEANQAWEQYQQNQIALLQERLKLNDINHLSFNDIVQQIENRFNDLNNQISELHDMKNVTNELLQANNGQFTTSNTHRSQDTQTITSNEHDQTQDDKSHNVSNHSPSPNVTKYEEEIRELQENLATLAARNTQLDEANRAWSQFHQIQLDSFRDKLRKSCRLDDIVTFDDIAQQVLAYVDQLKNKREVLMQQLQTAEKLNEDLRTETTNEMQTIKETYANTINDLTQQVILMKQQNDQLEIEKYTLSQELESLSIRSAQQERNTPTPDSTIADSQHSRQQKYPSPIPEAQIHNVSLNQAAPSPASQHELQQLRDDLDLLTSRCAQLDEANRAWQQYHQAQFQTFANLMHDILPIDETSSLDQAAQQIIGHISKERDDFNQRYHELQQQNDTLHTGIRSKSTTNLENMKEAYVNTINTLNEELFLKDRTQEAQIDNLRNQLASYLSTDSSSSLDDLIQQIVEQLRKQTEDFHHRYAQLERTNEELRSENSRNVAIRESYVNTVDELNRELLAMKEAYDQLDAEKQSMEKVSSESMKQQPISEMETENNEKNREELHELKDSFDLLSNRCVQLEEANRAWQSYQQNQIDSFRAKLVDYVPIDENGSFEQMAQTISDFILKERADSSFRYAEVEQANNEVRSESATNLETIKQSYVNTVDELNKELLSIKEQCKQLTIEKEDLNQQLQKQSIDFSQEQNKLLRKSPPSNALYNVPIHSTTADVEQESDEFRELRKKFEDLTSQYALLNEANRAWQEYHQSQLTDFRVKVQDCIHIDNDASYDDIAQQIVDQITKERNDYNKQYLIFEKTNTDLQSESIKENMELNAIQEQYQKLLHEKETLLHQLEKQTAANNQHQNTQTADSENVDAAQQQQQQAEMSELRENLTSLTNQLDETIRSWQQFEQKQLELLKNLLPFSNKTSLEDTIQEIIAHVNQLTKELDSSKENERELNHRYVQLREESQMEDIKMKEDLVLLQNQCGELDSANRAWQLFYNQQIDVVKNKLKDYISFNDNSTFDEIIQIIVDEFEQISQFTDNSQTESIVNNFDSLKKQLKDNQHFIESLNNRLQNLTDENEHIKQQNEEYQRKNDLLISSTQSLTDRERSSSPSDMSRQVRHTPISEAQIHHITPVQSTTSTDLEEEIQQLRTNLSVVTARCSQLDEANHAWLQYHQNQLDMFRNKLQDFIPLESDSDLEQIAQTIINVIDDKHNEHVDQLNQKLVDVYKQCEDYRANNAQLLLSKEQLEKQVEEQLQQINNFHLSNTNPEQLSHLQQHNDSLMLENQQLQMKINDMEQRVNQIAVSPFVQRIESPRENVGIHNIDHDRDQEIRQLRADLLASSAHCATLEEANRAWQKYQFDQIETLKQKLQEQIPSLQSMENTSLDFIGQHIMSYFSQLNDQRDNLMRHNDLLKDEIQLQKQQLERPGSTESEKRMQQRRSYDRNIREVFHNVSLNQAAPSPVSQHELQQLRDDLDLLTSRCAQLDEANRAWQQYHQAQFQTFANLMHDILPIDETSSLDQAAQQIIGYVGKERDDFNQRYHELQQQNDTLHTGIRSSISDFAMMYSAVSEDAQTTIASLTDELEQTKQSQQIQIDNLRNQLASYLSTDSSSSLDDLIQQIVEQLRKQTEDFHHRYAQLERTNEELRSENSRNVETIRESYVNTVDELNRELLAMKEAYDQLDAEKQSMETGSSESMKQPFSQMSTERNGIGNDRESEELRELRESFQLLASQCAQLEEANRAWQSYQQNQIDSFRVKLVDYVPIDENKSLDEMAQVIIDSILKERDEFNKKYTELEEAKETVGTQSDERSMSESNTDLNQELATLKSQYDELEKTNKQLASEKEEINNQLDDRSIVLGHHSVAELSTIDEVTENHSLNIPVENEEMCQIRADFDSINSQLVEITQTNQDELESFVSKLQTWIALTPTSTLTEVAHQIHNHFEEQQEKFSQRRDMATQTTVVSENVHIAVETNRLTFANHQTQIDRIEMIDQTSQTESFEQILAESEERNLYNVEDDDERLRDYMDELSTLPSDAFSDRLAKECQQILSKQNLSTLSYADLELNHLALLTVHLLYNQHLTDDAKHLYNETLIRALKQEYELINNEKLDHMEKYHSLEEKCREELNSNKKIYDKLQNKYDELLEQSELERFDSKKSVADLAEQYSLREKQFEFNLFNLHQENDKLKTNLHQLAEIQEKVSVDDYEQLKQDYDELINENELLKEYNSQMYQRKLQDDEPTTAKEVHDVEIQCHLSDEHRPTHTESSSWNNDWEEENTLRHPSTNESNLEKLSKDDEIKRLKTIISQMEHDSSVHSQKHQNKEFFLLDSSTHDIGIHCSLQSPTIYSSGQAGMEHEVDSTIQTDLAESEENDWNSQMSTFEIASEDDNMTTVTSEHAFKPTMDAETQTDEQVQEKLMQVNTKLKRALQSIKEKIHQAVEEQPELFSEVSEDTIERLDHLIVTIGNQAIQIEEFQNEREELLNKLEETEMKLKHSERNVDINEYENLIRALSSQRDSLLERNKQLEDDIQEIQSNSDMASSEHRTSSDNSTQTAIAPEQQQQQEQQRENVTVKDREPLTFTDRVFGYIPTPQTSHTIDNEAQTDELPYDKVTQVNTKLKRALQTIKDKIYQAVVERPDLFFETNDDTIERLECLISTIGNQATYIDNLQAEYDRAQREIDELRSLLKTNQDELDHERSTQTQPHTSTSDDKNLSIIEDCQKQINQLQQKLASNEDERSLFRERLNEVELELKKSTDNHASTIHMYEEQFESLVKERNAVVEEHALHLSEKLHEIEQLQEQLNKLKQSSNTTQMNDSSQEDIKSLQEVIRQQSDELRDLSDRYFVLSSQVDTQNDLEKQKKEIEEQLTSYKDQVEFLTRERLQLLEEKQKNNTLPIENEKQTGDQQHDKLVKLNSKLKRALQAFKDKICRLVIARPDLFVNIGEETTEPELTESEEHYDERIRQLQNSLERYQNQADSNEPIVSDHLVFEAPTIDHITTTSSSPTRDQHKQMKRLRQKLTANEDEQNQLRQRLTEVEHELKTRSDEHTSAIFKYEEQLKSLIKERNAVIELHAIRAAESQHEIAHLQDELKQSPATVRKDSTSHTNVKSLEDVVQQQSKELRELTDRYMALSAFIESREEFERQRKEADERLADYQSQIENLLQERSILVDEAEKNAILLAQIDDEKRSNDQHHEKLSKVNHKLKRALQTIKDKVHRVAIEKPELFANIGEDTNDRLDHLISFVDHQTSQINSLQLELDQSQEQFRDEIRELQNALEVFQHQIATNHPSDKIEEQMTDTSPSEISTYISSSVFESEQHQQQHQQQQQINHLREKLSANEDERTLIRNRLTDVEREFRKTLDECASTLSIYEQQIQSLMQERDGLIKQHEVQCEENQLEMVKVQNELVTLKQQQIYTDPNTDTSTRKEVLQQQTKRRQDVSEKYMNLLSQLDSNIYLQAELDKLGRETEQQLMNYEKQIENLVREREILLEEKRKNTSSTPVTTDNDKQTGDHQNEKLVKLNNKLKRALQTIKEKIQRIALERPDLFINIGEETNERLDHLIHTVESQATQIGLLQTELHESEEHLQHVVQQLENSFELYRQQAENDRQITPQESVSSPTVIARKTQSEYSERTQEIHSKQTSNEEHWNDWSTESIHCADERVHFHDVEVQCELLLDRPPSVQDVSDASEHRPASVTSRLFGALRNIASSLSEEPSGNDWDDQNSIIQLSTDEHAVQQSAMSPTSTDSLIHHIAHDLHQIVTENPHLFPQSTGDIAEDLNQLIIIIKSFQKEINDLQSSFDTRQLNTENVRSMTAEDMNSNINHNQTLSLSMIEEHQKEIDGLRERLYENGLTYQREIDRLIEEQNVAREQFTTKSSNEIESQTDFNNENSLIETRLSDCQCQIDVLLRERVSLMEQIKQLAHQPLKQHVEIQTENEQQPSTPSDQRISRRVFEQEMLAWSKESEQLKQFVKQIQVENKKLKEIILKFERLTHDYTQENERLKQENQHLSLLSYSSVKTTDENASSDTDICYLTLKWLTYEVAERTFDGSEPSSFIIDSNDPYIKQRLMDTERKLKSIRIQNQKLKKQLETYTIQFKHIQHEMNVKNQEFTILKAETDRLRISETQYRLEVDRLKADLQCDQVRIQQLEREIVDLKRETNRTDNSSTNNLRELLELKERELNALKEKLDYTTKAHQLELQEAIKANQFSLDNVQRYEQLDQQSQEKRKELETRLGKFCKMIRPLIDNQHLFKQNSIIDIDEIQRLITDTEAEEKVTNSLGAIRDCLGLLENQMKDLHHNLIENHARRSSKWKYKVGFECSSCDSQWEVTHDIQNLQEACQDPDLFLESSLIEPMSRCSCPSTADLTESDIRLCLDDLLDDVIVRTTVK
ncbi:hypothetical protein I4U23_021010 [Adineta vaga]|nr:hypothetical protein I4U23_021010 [Adineta vaga]